MFSTDKPELGFPVEIHGRSRSTNKNSSGAAEQPPLERAYITQMRPVALQNEEAAE
jgi:hypothetical protein